MCSPDCRWRSVDVPPGIPDILGIPDWPITDPGRGAGIEEMGGAGLGRWV